MNYVTEGQFDFFKELNSECSDDENTKICMISHTPITYNSVKLECNHEFNYLPLYKELLLNKSYRIIKCPYCRNVTDKLLPYVALAGVEKIYGINSPKSLCMDGPKCLYKLKNGKNKGSECGKDGVESQEGTFCVKHFVLNQSINVKKSKENKTSLTKIIWTVEKEDLFKRKSVFQLKQLLKEKGMKTTGLKKDLVNRVFIYNNANSSNNIDDMISLM